MKRVYFEDLCDPCRGRACFYGRPVVSLADSLNHRLMNWQASGLLIGKAGFCRDILRDEEM